MYDGADQDQARDQVRQGERGDRTGEGSKTTRLQIYFENKHMCHQCTKHAVII